MENDIKPTKYGEKTFSAINKKRILTTLPNGNKLVSADDSGPDRFPDTYYFSLLDKEDNFIKMFYTIDNFSSYREIISYTLKQNLEIFKDESNNN